jgi:F-type H+-transporting ATPase subunit gamma
MAFNFGREQTVPVTYVTYGKKGRDFVFRRGGNVIADYSPIPARPVLLDTTPITRQVIDDFLAGKVDEVWLCYTDYISAAVQKPTLKKLLPLAAEELLGETKSASPPPAYDFEPDPQGILDTLLPRLTEMQVYQAVLESLASEHSARMVAMRNATDNASDLILSLTLTYNKARQQAITSELLDIAGGSEALKQMMKK